MSAEPRNASGGAARHLPNLITCLRLLLAPLLLAAVLAWRVDMALLLAAVAGLSDAVDGFLARHFGWQSRLGAVLDPLADKLLLVCAFAGLAFIGRVPWPLAWLVIGRDLVIVIGAGLYRWRRGPFAIRPTLLSKATTLMQIVYVLWVLVTLAAARGLSPADNALAWIVAALTVASGLDYVWRWGRQAACTERSGR